MVFSSLYHSLSLSLCLFVYSISRERFLNCLRSLKRIRWWATQTERVRYSSFDDGSWNTLYVSVHYFFSNFFSVWLVVHIITFQRKCELYSAFQVIIIPWWEFIYIYFTFFYAQTQNSNDYLSLDIDANGICWR